MSTTRTMTVGQALIEFLAHQWTVDGDTRVRTIPGVLGIFGHGNVAGLGQALLQYEQEAPRSMPYYQGRNEQAMVHQAVGYARMSRRLQTLASTASVGPGSTNMITGAALATTNRLPALLLPSDTFATRVAEPVLQQLEQPWDSTLTVNDAFKPVSRFFDRVSRPEQLFSAALNAMRVLTDPAETGAVTLSLPQDVQTQTLEVPLEFLADREWRLHRPRPDRDALAAAVQAIRNARKPLIIAGGGVLYSSAEEQLRQFAEATGIPVATTHAGTGVLSWDHAASVGGVGATGTTAANELACDADLVIGIGTRYSDFTTGSRSAFDNPEVTFLNINIAAFDAHKHGSHIPVIADARETLVELTEALAGHQVDPVYTATVQALRTAWNDVVDTALEPTHVPLPGQPAILGAVQRAADPRDVVVQAAGSLPGELQKLWRVRDPLGYHVEYAYSCMGYEIPGGMGAKRAFDAQNDDRDVIVLVGDGTYLMLASELVTAVAEGLKVIVVLIQNHGYASIGNLSESVGSQRYGTKYRTMDDSGRFEGDTTIPVDLAMNARGFGIDVIEVEPSASAIADLEDAIAAAKKSSTSTLIHINSDPLVNGPDGGGWWDVPVAETSTLASTQQARTAYESMRRKQRPLLG